MTLDINTNTLDHIVHLTPPGTVDQATAQFQELGFTVIPGGTHADGLTANALVVLSDGVYLELISFTHPASHYPIDTPERRKRDHHRWASKSPGWIDYAFLGNGSTDHERSISNVINQRAAKEGTSGDVIYVPEIPGGRKRPDGVELKWLISSSQRKEQTGILPFFCGDVTPRDLRVPKESTGHPSTASGIAFVKVLATVDNFDRTAEHISTVVGREPTSKDHTQARWILETPTPSINPTEIVLAIASTDEEKQSPAAIYEVKFRVKHVPQHAPTTTPYGTISWVLE